MQKWKIRKSGQCSINIPKNIVDALNWKSGDNILVSKIPREDNIIIEKVTKK